MLPAICARPVGVAGRCDISEHVPTATADDAARAGRADARVGAAWSAREERALRDQPTASAFFAPGSLSITACAICDIGTELSCELRCMMR